MGSPCGLLNLNKPTGMTSRAVVDRVARPLRPAKVGHAGTLDPLASGVLVVAIGAATRLIEYVQRMPKVYRTVIRLGARSDTLDADGRIIETVDPAIPDEASVRAAVAGQVGAIVQMPPQFSALKVGGERAYDLARAGREVELAERPVVVHQIDVLDYAYPRLELEIACGGGTYIRSIARDLGETLGCGGLVEVLVRTAIGPFVLAEALDPGSLSADAIPGLLRPAVDALGAMPRLRLSAAQVAAIGQGRALDVGLDSGAGEVALLGPGDDLVAIGEFQPDQGRIVPRRVLRSG